MEIVTLASTPQKPVARRSSEPSGYLGLYTVDAAALFAERMRVTFAWRTLF
jgi:hypothetical protein